MGSRLQVPIGNSYPAGNSRNIKKSGEPLFATSFLLLKEEKTCGVNFNLKEVYYLGIYSLKKLAINY